MEDREVITARLDLIAAKAKVLVHDYRQGKLWDGDLRRGLEELKREIDRVCNESGAQDSWGR